MPRFKTVGQIARELGIPPRVISDLFYGHHLDIERCPIVGTRRLIPEDYLPELREILTERGVIQPARFPAPRGRLGPSEAPWGRAVPPWRKICR